jgi:hypothetical protein
VKKVFIYLSSFLLFFSGALPALACSITFNKSTYQYTNTFTATVVPDQTSSVNGSYFELQEYDSKQIFSTAFTTTITGVTGTPIRVNNRNYLQTFAPADYNPPGNIVFHGQLNALTDQSYEIIFNDPHESCNTTIHTQAVIPIVAPSTQAAIIGGIGGSVKGIVMHNLPTIMPWVIGLIGVFVIISLGFGMIKKKLDNNENGFGKEWNDDYTGEFKRERDAGFSETEAANGAFKYAGDQDNAHHDSEGNLL